MHAQGQGPLGQLAPESLHVLESLSTKEETRRPKETLLEANV